MTISFSPIPDCPTVQPFAECHGIDLSVGLGRDERALIKRRLLEHGAAGVQKPGQHDTGQRGCFQSGVWLA